MDKAQTAADLVEQGALALAARIPKINEDAARLMREMIHHASF